MGITIHELRAVITGNLVGFSKMVDDGIDKTAKFRKAWGDFAQDSARVTDRVLTTVGLLTAGIAGASAKMGFSFNSIKEQSEIAFTTMLGDGEKAKEFIAELTEFAAKTPFELPGLLDSTKKLMAFGFEAEKVIPMLTVVGDAAAGLGNPQAMDFIIRAIGQIQAKGKVAAQEMNQLAEQGIPAWKSLADAIGVSIPEAMKMAEQGMISAEVAIPAILQGMDNKFHGMMEKQSNSMSGLFSTLMDRLRGWTGTAFEPVYNSIKNGLSKLLSGDTLGIIDAFVARIQGVMGVVAAEIDAIFSQDPAAMFAAVGDVVEKVTQVFASFVSYLRQSGPEFAEVGRRVWGFIGPLLDYLKEHPQILAALIALKVTGFLGINTAVMSLAKALAETVLTLGRFAGASTTAGAALKGIGFGLAITAIVLLAQKIYETSAAMKAYNAAVKESQALNQKFDQQTDRKRELKLRGISEMTDPAAQREAIQAEIKKQKTELQGYESSAAGQQADTNAFAKTLTDSNDDAGNKILESMQAEADRAAQQARSTQAYIYRLEDELHNAEQRIGQIASGEGSPASSPVSAGSSDIFGMPEDKVAAIKNAGAQKEAEKRAEKAAEALEKFNVTLEQFAGQVPDDEIAAWSETFSIISKDFQAGELSAEQFRKGMDIITGALRDSAEMADRFASLREEFGDQTVDGWVEVFESLQNELRDGAISAEVYKSELALLDEEIKRSSQAEAQRTQFLNQMENLKDSLAAKKISLPDSVFENFNNRFSALTQQFTTGAMSATDFARATDALQRELNAAGDAAEKERQAKERARLLAGGFTQEEFQKGVEDRIIQYQQQQFEKQIEAAANAMLGFNTGLQNLNGQIDQFGNDFQNFSSGFSSFGQSIDLEQFYGAQQQFGAFLQTAQGQIATIQNQIALAKDRLNLESIVFGPALKGVDRWKTVEMIEQWTRQLVELQKAPPPQFIAGLGNFPVRDPGLQYGSGGGQQTVNLHFPNISRLTNQDVDHLIRSIDQEQQRRGASLFNNPRR